MKQRILMMMLAACLAAGASRADTAVDLPVDVINGSSVEVRGASAQREDSGVRTHGWVKRKFGRFGPIRAHLHIEGLNDQGSTLELLETQWAGNLSSRTRTPAHFSANFTSAKQDQIARVRISVQPNSEHDVKD